MIRLSKSCLSAAEKEAVLGVLDREYLGMGAEVAQFEQRLADLFGRPTVCVVNGTAALQIALQAAGIGVGDEVLVPTLTYIASFQAISATGAAPIPCDVEPDSLAVSAAELRRRLTPKTKAIMPVHYAGGLGQLDEILEFAAGEGLRVIEDAAHAFGSRSRGRLVGSFGDVACFSFDGIKNITSGEGGCIVTDDAALLAKAMDARLLGVIRDSDKRYRGERSWTFNVVAQGWRYHMSNLMAAIGLAQLNRFPRLAQKRQALARLYDELLGPATWIKRMPFNYSDVVPHIYPIQVMPPVSRDGLREHLATYDIQTGLHYQLNHELTFYKRAGTGQFPVAEAAVERLLTLPLHPDLDSRDVNFIAARIHEFGGAHA